MSIIYLPKEKFLQKYREFGGKKPAWRVKYSLRIFTDMSDIYVNQEAVFLNKKDYILSIAHTQGHIEGKGHTLFGVMSPFGFLRLTTTNIKDIQKLAKTAYQQSKGTPSEELAGAVNQEIQKWTVGNQEQMTQNVRNLIFTLKAKMSSYPSNKLINDLIEAIENEKDLSKSIAFVPILIGFIPQTVIGGDLIMGDIVKGDKIKVENVQGDVIGVGVKGKGNIIAKEVSGTINLNFQEYNKMPDEYAKSLKMFSQEVNAQLKKHNISQEKTAPVQESINELAKEVEGIKPEEKIDIEKKENIKSKITKVAIRLLKILPEGAETVATFTPLAPFSKIIGKSVEEIVKAIQNDI
jgi:hypothetical protein